MNRDAQTPLGWRPLVSHRIGETRGGVLEAWAASGVGDADDGGSFHRTSLRWHRLATSLSVDPEFRARQMMKHRPEHRELVWLYSRCKA